MYFMYTKDFNVFMGFLGHWHPYSQVKQFVDLLNYITFIQFCNRKISPVFVSYNNFYNVELVFP